MRSELRRQIEQLEAAISRFVVDNAPCEPRPASPMRGPAVLSTADLERTRDELVAQQAELRDHVVQRAVDRATAREAERAHRGRRRWWTLRKR
ncbi:MAG: hypothetical protein QOF76_5496 [Solirubrobacteraceae bacterium]|jgi:hypothetical protein|nr:hypothetical protein [Solirubrobacteraceae bacterium]